MNKQILQLHCAVNKVKLCLVPSDHHFCFRQIHGFIRGQFRLEPHLPCPLLALRLSTLSPCILYSLQFPLAMPGSYSTFNTQPTMLYHAGPQPCSPRQELQKTEAGSSGDYEFANNLQTSYTQYHLSHLLVEFPGYFPAEYGPQNQAPKDDENSWPEERFGVPQCRSPWTLSFSPEAGWDWPHEADVQPLHDPHEKQIWSPAGLGLPFQAAADGESDTTKPGSSSSSIPGDYYPNVTVGLLQTPHEASYDSSNLRLYQSTLGSSSDTNWGIQQSSR